MRFRRRELSRAEFDALCARLEELFPSLSQTSGRRSRKRNEAVGGDASSKHLSGMARDYVFDDYPTSIEQDKAVVIAKTIGLYAVWHGDHLHVQGRSPSALI